MHEPDGTRDLSIDERFDQLEALVDRTVAALEVLVVVLDRVVSRLEAELR